MADGPYEKIDPSKLILRDELAIDRTVLANERTVLAYSRTALTLLIAGVSFLHIVATGYLRVIGALCLHAGVLVGVFGWLRFARMKRQIESARKGTRTEET